MRRRAYLLVGLLVAALPALVAVGPDPLPPQPDPPAATKPKPAPKPAPPKTSKPTQPSQGTTPAPDPLPPAPDRAPVPKRTTPSPAKPTVPTSPPARRTAPSQPTGGFAPRPLTGKSPLIPPAKSAPPDTSDVPTPPTVLPDLRLPQPVLPGVTSGGKARTDHRWLILLGALAGLAFAVVGVMRLGRRRIAAARAVASPQGFVFPPPPSGLPSTSPRGTVHELDLSAHEIELSAGRPQSSDERAAARATTLVPRP
jgi:hypothetical protein